jgi:hypothetical protein
MEGVFDAPVCPNPGSQLGGGHLAPAGDEGAHLRRLGYRPLLDHDKARPPRPSRLQVGSWAPIGPRPPHPAASLLGVGRPTALPVGRLDGRAQARGGAFDVQHVLMPVRGQSARRFF